MTYSGSTQDSEMSDLLNIQEMEKNKTLSSGPLLCYKQTCSEMIKKNKTKKQTKTKPGKQKTGKNGQNQLF